VAFGAVIVTMVMSAGGGRRPFRSFSNVMARVAPGLEAEFGGERGEVVGCVSYSRFGGWLHSCEDEG
jgi:hypothetical protein